MVLQGKKGLVDAPVDPLLDDRPSGEEEEEGGEGRRSKEENGEGSRRAEVDGDARRRKRTKRRRRVSVGGLAKV